MDEKYRRAVDAAAIFSETDLGGSITYAVSYTHLTLPTNREV